MPAKTLFRLGLSFLFLAAIVYFATGHWLDSRLFTPVDYPVSLDSPHLKPAPFQVNLRETYYVSLELDPNTNDWERDYPRKSALVFDSRWRVYRLAPNQSRELWAVQPDQPRHFSNEFLGSRGRYELEWDIPTSAPCLNSSHPRLLVHTFSEGHRDAVGLIQLFCILWGGTGLTLVTFATRQFFSRFFSHTSPPRIFPQMQLRNLISIRRHAPLQPIHYPPHWGLLWAALLWILVFIFMAIQPVPLSGLFVSLEKPEFFIFDGNSDQKAVSVYVRSPSHFFVNGQEVAKNNLRVKLLEQRQIPWTIYFEADPDISYGDAVYAIDTIQGCGPKLIWITPKLREEWKHQTRLSRRNLKSTARARNP